MAKRPAENDGIKVAENKEANKRGEGLGWGWKEDTAKNNTNNNNNTPRWSSAVTFMFIIIYSFSWVLCHNGASGCHIRVHELALMCAKWAYSYLSADLSIWIQDLTTPLCARVWSIMPSICSVSGFLCLLHELFRIYIQGLLNESRRCGTYQFLNQADVYSPHGTNLKRC